MQKNKNKKGKVNLGLLKMKNLGVAAWERHYAGRVQKRNHGPASKKNVRREGKRSDASKRCHGGRRGGLRKGEREDANKRWDWSAWRSNGDQGGRSSVHPGPPAVRRGQKEKTNREPGGPERSGKLRDRMHKHVCNRRRMKSDGGKKESNAELLARRRYMEKGGFASSPGNWKQPAKGTGLIGGVQKTMHPLVRVRPGKNKKRQHPHP